MRIDWEPEVRKAKVKFMFGEVAGYYDPLNHLFSMGRDIFWRRAAARRAKVFRTGRILDLATGTGDLALALAEAHPRARVVGIDFCRPMLRLGQEKIRARNLSLPLMAADALCLPFPDETFDTATIAFGIRNIPDKEQALTEIRRVLVPEGRILILEFTFPHWTGIKNVYGPYLNRLIPKIGGRLSGTPEAYQYLADSIMDFPDPEVFRDLVACAGFRDTGFTAFTFGIALLYWGEK